MGSDPGFERPACLAALKSSDRTKQSVCGWQYIYIYITSEPLKHQFIRKDNDKDSLETNIDQLDSGYHRDKER